MLTCVSLVACRWERLDERDCGGWEGNDRSFYDHFSSSVGERRSWRGSGVDVRNVKVRKMEGRFEMYI